MKPNRASICPAWIVAILFFIAYFFYFAVFNLFHLFYQEQVQLFRFSWDYLFSYLGKPGGFSDYLGNFFIQFYLIPLAGPLVISLAGIVVFVLSKKLLKKFNISGILWSLIPVMMIAALQSDQVYYLGYTIGFILILAFSGYYVSIKSIIFRSVTGVVGTIILYHAAGNLTIVAFLLILINELKVIKDRRRFVIASAYTLLMILCYFLVWDFIYLLPKDSEWLNILFNIGGPATKYWMLLLLAYYPVLVVITRILFVLSTRKLIIFKWNIKTILTGTLIVLLFGCCIFRFAYDSRTELLLGIDKSVQDSKWDKALKLSSRLPGTNRIAVYLTNLALYNSGHFGDKLFNYNQIGSQGLVLGWGDDASPYFGCEVFYQLGYINEAYHWAFEAMVVKGQSPRLIKILVKTSLINGDYKVADKFLDVLNKTLFYKKWARSYRKFVSDPSLLLKDKEISAKRRLLIHSDFFADVNNYNGEFLNLLKNHPDNKMAYDYLVTSKLLDKDIPAFANSIRNLKDFGYNKIPVLYEEALLSLGDNLKPEIVPEGLTISESTRQRFENYISAYSVHSLNPEKAMNNLYKKFGNTYWYYLQFR